MPTRPLRTRSKSVATWLAVAGGSLGLHRFYLYGYRDRLAWLHPWPTLIGLAGVVRMRNLGQDDMLSWALIPALGLMVSAGMLSAILMGLTPDERWAERHQVPGTPPVETRWVPILGVILALLLGGTALMGTIAFGGQKFFEWQQQAALNTSAR
jgi:hypothetical protein